MVRKMLSVLMLVPFLLIVFNNKLFAAEWPDELMTKVEELHNLAKDKKDMPSSLDGIKVISDEEAYKLWKEKKATFLDNRVKSQYDTEKIPGAVWFFCDDLIKKGPSMAETLDKNKEYVVYCNGVHCWRSPAVALMLKHLGFKILWYRNGLPGWKSKGYPTE